MVDPVQSADDSFARAELSGVLLESVEEICGEAIGEEDLVAVLDRARQVQYVRMSYHWWRSPRLLAAAAMAAILLVALLLWHDRNSVAWAEVVDAVAKKPWLRAVTTYHDGTKAETWFSTSRRVLGGRIRQGEEERLVWLDFVQKIREDYDPKENRIVRVSDTQRREETELFEAIYSAFLAGETNRTIDKGRLEFVHEQQRAVEDDGRRWIEHRFKWQDEDDQGSSGTEWVVDVDPKTRLPFRYRQISLPPPGFGSEMSSVQSWEIDYPDTGPASIYDLGASRSAKVVDLSLNPKRPDVERLMTGVDAARWRADRYHVLAVWSRDDQHWSQAEHVYLVWRNGSRYRVETNQHRVTRPRDELAPEDADPQTWWRQKVQTVKFRPYEVCDGKWIWTYKVKSRLPTQEDIDAGASEAHRVIISIDKERKGPVIPRRGVPDHGWGGGPEFAGRPRFFHYRPPYSEVRLDSKPTTGPPNAVLLEIRDPLWKPEHARASLGPGRCQPQMVRDWIDTERGYLIMRRERLATLEGKEEILGGSVIEGVTQCPRGHWYPTTVRYLKRSIYVATDRVGGRVIRYYYDFDVPMPDELFEP